MPRSNEVSSRISRRSGLRQARGRDLRRLLFPPRGALRAAWGHALPHVPRVPNGGRLGLRANPASCSARCPPWRRRTRLVDSRPDARGTTPRDGREAKRARRSAGDGGGLPLGLILVGLLAAYGLLFILFNSEQVDVSFVFFNADISLVVALLIMGGIGFVAGYSVRELRARRSARRPAP